jgi:hypothetical protein
MLRRKSHTLASAVLVKAHSAYHHSVVRYRSVPVLNLREGSHFGKVEYLSVIHLALRLATGSAVFPVTPTTRLSSKLEL